MRKRIIILSLVALFAVFALPSLIGCNTAPVDAAPVETEYIPEVVQTPEPVLLLCVVCEEYKEEHEHCYDWQATLIERLNRERAEREAAAEALAEAEELLYQERLDAWLELPEEDREELMALARAEVEQWWEDLIQEQYENMIANGWTFVPEGRTPREAHINIPEHIIVPEFGYAFDLFVILAPHLRYSDPADGEIHLGFFSHIFDLEHVLGSVASNAYGEGLDGITVFGYSIDGDLVVPYEYVLCITRLWVAECKCVMPPDWGQ